MSTITFNTDPSQICSVACCIVSQKIIFMQGILNEQQVENILLSQAVGRIACCYKGKPYIVPITYVYNGEYIYGQTQEGKKMNMLRKIGRAHV